MSTALQAMETQMQQGLWEGFAGRGQLGSEGWAWVIENTELC